MNSLQRLILVSSVLIGSLLASNSLAAGECLAEADFSSAVSLAQRVQLRNQLLQALLNARGQAKFDLSQRTAAQLALCGQDLVASLPCRAKVQNENQISSDLIDKDVEVKQQAIDLAYQFQTAGSEKICIPLNQLVSGAVDQVDVDNKVAIANQQVNSAYSTAYNQVQAQLNYQITVCAADPAPDTCIAAARAQAQQTVAQLDLKKKVEATGVIRTAERTRLLLLRVLGLAGGVVGSASNTAGGVAGSATNKLGQVLGGATGTVNQVPGVGTGLIKQAGSLVGNSRGVVGDLTGSLLGSGGVGLGLGLGAEAGAQGGLGLGLRK